jgi:hypothetical protein
MVVEPRGWAGACGGCAAVGRYLLTLSARQLERVQGGQPAVSARQGLHERAGSNLKDACDATTSARNLQAQGQNSEAVKNAQPTAGNEAAPSG